MRPGFDSVGIAVTRYLTIEVMNQLIAGSLSMIWEQGFRQVKNLLLSTSLFLSQLICSLIGSEMTSEVPLARGLEVLLARSLSLRD